MSQSGRSGRLHLPVPCDHGRRNVQPTDRFELNEGPLRFACPFDKFMLIRNLNRPSCPKLEAKVTSLRTGKPPCVLTQLRQEASSSVFVHSEVLAA
ncbi:MAG: hypothetical protein ACTS7I_01965 [Candidatus Hodgkinia cicadicola]